MKKILFLIHDLDQGGAEKVLINLVNHLDRSKFDISVTVLFGGGINESSLRPDIHFRAVFPRVIPGNSHWMKLMTPRQLHRLCVRERYDIEVSYLEGPSARVISGCPHGDTKLVGWVHVEQHTMATLAGSFRSPEEARRCYDRFHQTVFVSESVREDFCRLLPLKHPCAVYYNTVESNVILEAAKEEATLPGTGFQLVGVGTLKESKGFDRLIRIVARLRAEGICARLNILGRGPLREELEALAGKLGIGEHVTFLGYQTNPYKFVARSDLFVCASFAEGFSTAATEALIVGTPVCTVEVSGMVEMLGQHNEYGIITENDEDALFEGIRSLLSDPEKLRHYRTQAALRGKHFRTEETVRSVEDMLLGL